METVADQFSSYSIGRRSPSWEVSLDGLVIRVWRSRWSQRETLEDGFRSRSTVFLVKADDSMIAVGHFDEWRVDEAYESGDLPDLDLFFDIADNRSHADYELAAMILSEWPEEHRGLSGPFDYGNVVHFDRMRIAATSAAQSQIVWQLISILIAREFGGKSRARIMFLKPFPLEYEGVGADDTPAFRRRHTAMLRLYQRRLGIRRLGTDDDWFWIDLGRGCRPPLAPP